MYIHMKYKHIMHISICDPPGFNKLTHSRPHGTNGGTVVVSKRSSRPRAPTNSCRGFLIGKVYDA